jgi:hypothetical protein
LVHWNKIEQHRAVSSAAVDLAFDAVVLSTPAELASHLEATSGCVVLRPEFSADRGSALFRWPETVVPQEDLDNLWQANGRVLAHAFMPGTSYFLNGVVVEGEFAPSDFWRCFTIDVGVRRLLAGVVNQAYDSSPGKLLVDAVRQLLAELGIDHGPVCFEFVLSDQQVKVVKIACRIVGAPLPSLCGEVGWVNQQGLLDLGREALAVPTDSHGYVADYALLAHHSGFLESIEGIDRIRAMPSYVKDLTMPRPGTWIARATGEDEVAVVLLRHEVEQVLLTDVEHLQRLNQDCVFVLSGEKRDKRP